MNVKATEIKNRFGQYLEKSLREPVFIEKTGRIVSVMISIEDYERLMQLEDEYWIKKAQQAEKEGYLTPKESSEYLRSK